MKKIKEKIVAEVEEFKLRHSVMIYNDSSYWRGMNNRYWPAYYILDKKGNLRATFFGETHEGDNCAKQIENVIKQLLNETT